jgi:tRNA(Ile)-lysidine synthase
VLFRSEYAIENKISWREDSSNKTTKYLRNKLRHDVIPILKEVQPDLLSNFQQTIQHLQDSQSIINDAIQYFKNEVVIEKEDVLYFDCDKIVQFSIFVFCFYSFFSACLSMCQVS